MKKYNSILKYIFIVFASLFITGCVQDDKYDAPTLNDYQCKSADFYEKPENGFVKWSLQELKQKPLSQPFTEKAYIEGYVSSSDETGNIYKTIYIQDAPENPTEGLTISVDAVSLYANFPQGSKVYIELKGLAVTTYGGVTQLGMITSAGTRIVEKEVPNHIFRDCKVRANIIPKVMTFAEMSSSDKLIGCLIQADNVEFDAKVLCTTYAPTGVTVDKAINQKIGNTLTSRIVRNSGYAGFANDKLPAGNGKFVGILSKYNSTYQLYINKASDLKMDKFPRIDGIAADPCGFNPSTSTAKTVSEVKQLLVGTSTLTEIKDNFYVKGKVTTSDATGNLYKYLYIEDATGGIKVNIDKTDLNLDPRFKIGKELIVNLKGLYVGSVNGELQIGSPFNGVIGRIVEADIYKYLFDSGASATQVVPTERTISQLTTADVGRWVKFKNLQFADSEVGKTYAAGAVTNRTLQDCNGNTIFLRTSNLASFAGDDIDEGKGDVYAIVSIFNGVYQLWIVNRLGVDLDGVRCDGSMPESYSTIFKDGFDNLNNWTTVNVTGSQVWTTTTFGNPRPSAYMDGQRQLNEDWLISGDISLDGYKNAFFSFETDGRYSGNPLEVYVTDNYTGNPSTTTWTKMNEAIFDTDLNNFSGFVNSGRVSLTNFAGKKVKIGFKYTSTAGFSTTWELDNFAVKGSK